MQKVPTFPCKQENPTFRRCTLKTILKKLPDAQTFSLRVFRARKGLGKTKGRGGLSPLHFLALKDQGRTGKTFFYKHYFSKD